jgi:hypothetical protein
VGVGRAAGLESINDAPISVGTATPVLAEAAEKKSASACMGNDHYTDEATIRKKSACNTY